MNQEDPARLLRHVMLFMPRGIWHAIDAAAMFTPSLQQTSGLNAFELETLILNTTRKVFYFTIFGKNHKLHFLQRCTLYPSPQPCLRWPKHNYLLCIGQPDKTCAVQLKQAHCCVMVHPRHSNQLPPGGSNEKNDESKEKEEDEIPTEERKDKENHEDAAYLDERRTLVFYVFTFDVHGTTHRLR